ncbi:MAG: hypothetical protein WCI01_09935 [Chlorobiaceae bacterium]
MSLTTDDARMIADAFLDAAQSIEDYIDLNYQQGQHKISRAEYEFLYESFQTLLRISSYATTAAVGLAIDTLDAPANDLKNVIEEAKQKIKNLQKISSVILCVSALVSLASSIISKDPKAIVTSINHLRKQIL